MPSSQSRIRVSPTELSSDTPILRPITTSPEKGDNKLHYHPTIPFSNENVLELPSSLPSTPMEDAAAEESCTMNPKRTKYAVVVLGNTYTYYCEPHSSGKVPYFQVRVLMMTHQIAPHPPPLENILLQKLENARHRSPLFSILKIKPVNSHC